MSDPNTKLKIDINKQNMEIDGINKVIELKKTNEVTQYSLLKIIDDGNNEFKNEFGRNMTYSEMRARYG
jgi:hypothetical protein